MICRISNTIDPFEFASFPILITTGGGGDAMRLGLFGGSFDPIHLGHLLLAESCREALGLDRLWFVVAGAPPNKPGQRTGVDHRLEMARVAIAGHPSFEVSEIEAKTPGPHYTFQTLEAVRRDHPDASLFFLIGGDSLIDLPHWKEPGLILQRATVVAVDRPGVNSAEHTQSDAMDEVRRLWDETPDARPLERVESPRIGIASRDLRRRAAEGRSIRYQVPRGVEAYIEAHGLYRQPEPEADREHAAPRH